MVVVTLINRLRSVQSLLLLMTSVVMGNKTELCNSLSELCTERAALGVVTVRDAPDKCKTMMRDGVKNEDA